MRLASRTFLLVSALSLFGCYDQGEGIEPPLDRIYFPVAIALSPGASRLYLANSDFDLQFNGGALQAFDLPRIRSLVPRACASDADCVAGEQFCDSVPTEENGGHPSDWCVAASGPDFGKPCGPFGEKSPAHKALRPGRCSWIGVMHPQDGGPPLVVDEVGIGAFATDILYRPRPNGPGGRLFVPVRGDATLHYIDVIDDEESPDVPFELECGQAGNEGDCDDAHRRGDDPDEENTRDLRLAAEPFGVAGTADGSALVLTHQTEGSASLFVNDDSTWGDGAVNFGSGPLLSFSVTGLPERPIGVASLPEPKYVTEWNQAVAEGTLTEEAINYQPGFLVTFRNAPLIVLLRYYSDSGAEPSRPFIEAAASTPITINSLGFDSRGIALDPTDREACEAACPTDATRLDCLRECAAVPIGVYVANRTPSTLLVGETRPNQSETSSDDVPRFFQPVPLPFGPSRVFVGKVIDLEGKPSTRVFVLCFDSRKIGVFNPKSMQIEKWIETGRGPHGFALEIAKDNSYAYAYVAHFTDSYIGIADLDERHETFGTFLTTVGKPTAPRASK